MAALSVSDGSDKDLKRPFYKAFYKTERRETILERTE